MDILEYIQKREIVTLSRCHDICYFLDNVDVVQFPAHRSSRYNRRHIWWYSSCSTAFVALQNSRSSVIPHVKNNFFQTKKTDLVARIQTMDHIHYRSSNFIRISIAITSQLQSIVSILLEIWNFPWISLIFCKILNFFSYCLNFWMKILNAENMNSSSCIFLKSRNVSSL